MTTAMEHGFFKTKKETIPYGNSLFFVQIALFRDNHFLVIFYFCHHIFV